MKFTVLALFILIATAPGLGFGCFARALASSPQFGESPLHLSRKELKIYNHARTLLDWTPREIKHTSSLRKLRPASNQKLLPMILSRVGKAGMEMLSEFRNVTCDEKVYSEWTVGKHVASSQGIGPREASRSFRYIIIPAHAGDHRIFREYRTDPDGKPVDFMDLRGFQMITSNFAGSWAYLDTPDQRESRFRYFGEEPVRREMCYVVGFAQIPGRAQTVSTIDVDYHSFILLVQGLAWIDKRSFHVVKIETWLLAPRRDIGLESQNTTVEYHPVKPAGMPDFFWLPEKVTVVVHFNGSFIRNTHTYSKYKLFRVGSSIKP